MESKNYSCYVNHKEQSWCISYLWFQSQWWTAARPSHAAVERPRLLLGWNITSGIQWGVLFLFPKNNSLNEGGLFNILVLSQNAVATYKETRNGLIGVDYSTKFSPWWVFKMRFFIMQKQSRWDSCWPSFTVLQACVGLHITQIHLWADKEVRGRANRQPKHILVRNVDWNMFSNKINSFQAFICKNTKFLFARVIFELLWRDYFKFVGLKYGNRLFHMNGESGFVLCVLLIYFGFSFRIIVSLHFWYQFLRFFLMCLK